MIITIPLGSKNHFTQKQIEELKTELKKTEYEKAREPLEKRISILERKLYNKEIALQSLYVVCKEFLHNNIKNNQIVVSVMKPHLFYGEVNDITSSKLETIKIDLSDYKILQEFHKRLNEVEQQLKGE